MVAKKVQNQTIYSYINILIQCHSAILYLIGLEHPNRIHLIAKSEGFLLYTELF